MADYPTCPYCGHEDLSALCDYRVGEYDEVCEGCGKPYKLTVTTVHQFESEPREK